MSLWLQVSLLSPPDHTYVAILSSTSFSFFVCLSCFLCQMRKIHPFEDKMRECLTHGPSFSQFSLFFLSCLCRNYSSFHLQPEERFFRRWEERANSPRLPRALGHIRRARSGSAPRTVLRIKKREARWGLTWTIQDVCVLEGRGWVACTSTCLNVWESLT